MLYLTKFHAGIPLQILRKTCQNMGFLWPVFSRIRTETSILYLYGKIQAKENSYSVIDYAVIMMMMMNYFCEMFDLRSVSCCISSRVHHQEASPSSLTNTSRYKSKTDLWNSNPWCYHYTTVPQNFKIWLISTLLVN